MKKAPLAFRSSAVSDGARVTPQSLPYGTVTLCHDRRLSAGWRPPTVGRLRVCGSLAPHLWARFGSLAGNLRYPARAVPVSVSGPRAGTCPLSLPADCLWPRVDPLPTAGGPIALSASSVHSRARAHPSELDPHSLKVGPLACCSTWGSAPKCPHKEPNFRPLIAFGQNPERPSDQRFRWSEGLSS